MLKVIQNKESNMVYKSLYEVKDKFLPHADLGFLESTEDDYSQNEFMQVIKKVKKRDENENCAESKSQ